MSEQVEQREYFISYNSADAAYAQALSDALEAEGISHHFAGSDVSYGNNIAHWMDQALMGSIRMIALCSADYFDDKAEYSAAERAATFMADPIGQKARLVPVQLDDCEFTPLFNVARRMDVRGMSPEQAATHIIAELRTDEQKTHHKTSRLVRANPLVFNVGRPRLPAFTGRFDDLDAIHLSLSQGENAAVTQAVTGLGGIGKTTLAAEYAHRFGTQGRYGGVWWVNAESGVLQGLADLAPVWNALNETPAIPVPEALPDQARAVLSWLGARPIPWLVIYDNVHDPDAIQDWMPAGSTRVLITSRFDGFQDLAQTRSLDKWDIATSAEFLLSATNRDDRAGAQALAERLDGLPLALDQAASYLKDREGIRFADYADRIQQMLKRPRDKGRQGAYPDTVYASLVISIEALPEPAQDLMCLLSWLSPDGVEEALIAGVAEQAPQFVPDPLGAQFRDEFNRADLMQEVQAASLLRTATDPNWGQVLITHRVVQAVTREWQAQQAKSGWDAHATGMVNAAFPDHPSQPANWERAAHLLPHAVELADHGPRQGEPGQWLGRLLNQAGLFRDERGDTDGAIALTKPMVEIIAAVFTEYSEQYCSALSNLSSRYIDTGRYAEAEAGFLKVLKIEQKLLGPEAPTIAIRLNNLARVYWKQDQFSKAKPLLVRALEIRQKAHGDESTEVANGLNSLGALYDTWAEQPRQEHRREQARELKEQAVETARKAVGERHPNVSDFLHNLAILFDRLEEFSHAAELELRSLAILVSLWGFEHPEVANNGAHLAHFWEKPGQGDRKDRVMEFLVPEIVAVETQMMAWVQEDPDNRHFGPESFFVGRERLLEGLKDENV